MVGFGRDSRQKAFAVTLDSVAESGKSMHLEVAAVALVRFVECQTLKALGLVGRKDSLLVGFAGLGSFRKYFLPAGQRVDLVAQLVVEALRRTSSWTFAIQRSLNRVLQAVVAASSRKFLRSAEAELTQTFLVAVQFAVKRQKCFLLEPAAVAAFGLIQKYFHLKFVAAWRSQKFLQRLRVVEMLQKYLNSEFVAVGRKLIRRKSIHLWVVVAAMNHQKRYLIQKYSAVSRQISILQALAVFVVSRRTLNSVELTAGLTIQILTESALWRHQTSSWLWTIETDCLRGQSFRKYFLRS